MASIVYYTNPKTGRITAYRSEAKWNPEKGYSVPKRTYLGIVDPVTMEIIPSSGRRGRPRKSVAPDSQAAEYKAKYESALEELKKLRARIGELEKENGSLKERQGRTAGDLRRLERQIQAMLGDS